MPAEATATHNRETKITRQGDEIICSAKRTAKGDSEPCLLTVLRLPVADALAEKVNC